MEPKQRIQVMGTEINIFNKDQNDYICLTDIDRFKNSLEPKDVVKNWMRLRNTIEFL